MSVSNDFHSFCSNLWMRNNRDNIVNRYHLITKRINTDFWGIDSDTINSYYIGSYGRGTEIFTSDIDILVKLPYDVYERFDNYILNGQSALLQYVKDSLQKTYPLSSVKGDGQVVVIPFTDGITFEILPAFINTDESYTYPDSNNGGTWKVTNPMSEIDAINTMNNITNKNLKRLCRMVRAWKQKNNVDMKGILIDTLAYNFMSKWEYSDKSYSYYDYMSRDFFKYLTNTNSNQKNWSMPGSGRMISKTSDFIPKADEAYQLSLTAIEQANKGYEFASRKTWREIYGSKFPQ